MIRTILIVAIILGVSLMIPMTTKASNTNPPVEECSIWTSGPNGVEVGIGGYSPSASIVSATVNWGDGAVETSTDWNYCSASMTANYVIVSQFGHIWIHQYKALGIYTITQTLTDTNGLTFTDSNRFQVVSTVPATPGPSGGCCMRPS